MTDKRYVKKLYIHRVTFWAWNGVEVKTPELGSFNIISKKKNLTFLDYKMIYARINMMMKKTKPKWPAINTEIINITLTRTLARSSR